MAIELKDFLIDQLMNCPTQFQQRFRKIYQQLKVVDHPLEVKGITGTGTAKFYKITISKSRIGLHHKGTKLVIVCFLYNQFFQ